MLFNFVSPLSAGTFTSNSFKSSGWNNNSGIWKRSTPTSIVFPPFDIGVTYELPDFDIPVGQLATFLCSSELNTWSSKRHTVALMSSMISSLLKAAYDAVVLGWFTALTSNSPSLFCFFAECASRSHVDLLIF